MKLLLCSNVYKFDELLRTRHHDKSPGGGFKHFLFSPLLGEMMNIFQMGWNHYRGQHQIPIGESVLCSFVSDHLKHIEERGMWYMRDSCSWDTRFASGVDILRKLHLLFNNRFFSPTKQTWNLENNFSNQQIFQHFISWVLGNVLCIGFCCVAKVTGYNVQPKTVGRTLVTRTQQVKSWKEEVTLTYSPWN